MKSFIPRFCPNPECSAHEPDPASSYSDYLLWGSYETKAFGQVQRFRCSRCGKTFSRQTFRVDYYAKQVVDYDDLAGRLSSCESLRAIGRALGRSCDSVSNRISRAARQALAAESRLSSFRAPSENLAADGFESFCVSQYFPNNIHLLVGQESQFAYAANHVTLRRKGRMTKRQRRRREELEKRYRVPPKGIEGAFAAIGTEALRVLSDSSRLEITLWTDCKREYRWGLVSRPCIAALEESGRLRHRTVSSRAARTRENPLFAVNYLDRELRKDLHEHTRETVCFGRNVNHQMERLAVYLFEHNYRKEYRIPSDRRTHAEVAGYDQGAIKKELEVLWRDRAFLSLEELTPSMEASWLRKRETPLKEGEQYLPRYAAM